MHRLLASVKAPAAVDKLVGRDLAGWCLGGVGLGVAASLLQKGAADVFTRPTELTERVANELARR